MSQARSSVTYDTARSTFCQNLPHRIYQRALSWLVNSTSSPSLRSLLQAPNPRSGSSTSLHLHSEPSMRSLPSQTPLGNRRAPVGRLRDRAEPDVVLIVQPHLLCPLLALFWARARATARRHARTRRAPSCSAESWYSEACLRQRGYMLSASMFLSRVPSQAAGGC